MVEGELEKFMVIGIEFLSQVRFLIDKSLGECNELKENDEKV